MSDKLIHYRVEISAQAETDIRSIYEYIAYTLQSPENAVGQLERIENRIIGLNIMPERFRLYEKEPWKSRNLHIVSVDNYCVLYLVNANDSVVHVLRVMYCSRDIDQQLNTNID